MAYSVIKYKYLGAMILSFKWLAPDDFWRVDMVNFSCGTLLPFSTNREKRGNFLNFGESTSTIHHPIIFAPCFFLSSFCIWLYGCFMARTYFYKQQQQQQEEKENGKRWMILTSLAKRITMFGVCIRTHAHTFAQCVMFSHAIVAALKSACCVCVCM